MIAGEAKTALAKAAGTCRLEDDAAVKRAPALAVRRRRTATDRAIVRLADDELADEGARLCEGDAQFGRRFGNGVSIADL